MAFTTTTQGDSVEYGQDFDRRVGTSENTIGVKRLMTMARTERRDNLIGAPDIARQSKGPVVGWHSYAPESVNANPPVWSEAFPITSRKGKGGLEYRIVGPEKWEEADGRWRVPGGATPDDNLYPGGWAYASLRTSEENAQNVALLPGFVGLVAPHFAGDEDYGTQVYDITADNELDRDRKAPLQSLCRVYAYPESKCVVFGAAGDYGVALQLGDARSRRAGFGMVADFPVAASTGAVVGAGPVVSRGPIQQVLAALSVNSGGFIDVGDGNDQHQLGVNIDGEACNGAHISERANYRGATGDSPKEYDPVPWIEPNYPPYLTKTYHRNDASVSHPWTCGDRKGLRKWEGLSYFRIKDGSEPPLDDPLPPENGERIDGYVVGRTRRELDLAATDLELGTVALVGVPQHFGGGKQDLRNALSTVAGRRAFAAARARGELVRPSVGRMEWGGKESGSGWELTNRPGASVYRDGDAQGFAAFMPSNYSLGYAAPSVNPGFQVVMWDSEIAWGEPSLSVGGVVSGFQMGLASGQLRTSVVDSAGSATRLMNLTTGGILTVLDSVFVGSTSGASPGEFVFLDTPYTLTLDSAANTGSNEVITAPWETGTIALLETNQTFSGDETFSAGLYHTGSEFGVFGSVSSQPAAISTPSGGVVEDAEARDAISAILTALRSLGIIDT